MLKNIYKCELKLDELKQESKGQYICDHCQHKVYDMSAMTNQEIKTLLSASGKVCGIIQNDRLVQEKTLYQRLAMAAATVGIIFSSALSKAQGILVRPEIKETLKAIEQDKIITEGLVKDQKTAEAIPFASVIVQLPDGTVLGQGQTNFDGKYRILLDSLEFPLTTKVEIRFVCLGYTSKVVKASLGQLKHNKETVLSENQEPATTMGLIIEYHPQLNLQSNPNESIYTRDQIKNSPK